MLPQSRCRRESSSRGSLVDELALSPWLIGGVALGATAYVLRKPERRQVVGARVMPLIKAYSDGCEHAAAQEQRCLRGIREVMLQGPATPSPKQQVAIVLAREREPLLAREIQEQMLDHFAAKSVPTVREVRAVVKDGSEFVAR
jgi:hypothetical protein